MVFVWLFILELIGLLTLSQLFSRIFSRWLIRITESPEKTIHIMSALFLPGVILHEIAHWFVAGMLLVKTGEMEFLPQIQGNTVKLGSVAIAQTDPFRRFLIGVAPVLVGLVAMFGIFTYFSSAIPGLNWQTLLVTYLFFEIGNTMFSSKKDMEGAIFLVVFTGILLLIFYIASVRFGIMIDVSIVGKFFANPVVGAFLQKLSLMLTIPLGIDFLLCLPSFLPKK
jgi:hypothetical protein